MRPHSRNSIQVDYYGLPVWHQMKRTLLKNYVTDTKENIFYMEVLFYQNSLVLQKIVLSLQNNLKQQLWNVM